MSRANSKKIKLLKALEELITEGKKVSPFAVEKRAGASNGLARHYEDVMEKILQAKESSSKTTKTVTISPSAADSLKRRLAGAQEKAKKQEELKLKVQDENKRLKDAERSYADTIAQLTWELHKQLSQEKPLNVRNMK